MSTFSEVDHPRSGNGRFRARGRATTASVVDRDVRIAAEVDDRWPADEPDVTPVDDPVGGGMVTWKGAGFTRAEADGWWDAGVRNPVLARRVADLHPDLDRSVLARVHDGDGSDPFDVSTVAEALAAGDVTVEELPSLAGTAQAGASDGPF